jgi:hypothetical protein
MNSRQLAWVGRDRGPLSMLRKMSLLVSPVWNTGFSGVSPPRRTPSVRAHNESC